MSDKRSLSVDKIHASRKAADDKRAPTPDEPLKMARAVGRPRRFNPALMANVRDRGVAGNTRSASGTMKPVDQPAINGGTGNVHSVAAIATTNPLPHPSTIALRIQPLPHPSTIALRINPLPHPSMIALWKNQLTLPSRLALWKKPLASLPKRVLWKDPLVHPGRSRRLVEERALSHAQ